MATGGYGILRVLSGLVVLVIVLVVITFVMRRLNIHRSFLSFHRQGSHQELHNCQEEGEDTAL